MAPKRLVRREQTSNRGVANQLAHLLPPPGDIGVDEILDDLTTFNVVMAQNPDLLEQFKKSLICMGQWPQSANAASSSSSGDHVAGDSSGSGERPAATSMSSRVSADQGSDESANTKENKGSGGSTMTPGPTAREADSSGSSAAGNAGRNQCASDQVGAWLIKTERSKDNDGQSSDSSAKGRDSEKSSSGAVAGSSGCMGDDSSSAQRWEYNEPGDGTPLALKESSDDSDPCRKAADGENSEDSGPRVPQDLAGVGIDCLPQDAFVWVLGQDAPKLTVELQPGDQVCCFDSLGKNIKYVKVTDVSVDDEPVEWVRLELADGTKTVLTTDHPMQVSCKNAPQEVVKAGDIEPQKSRIMVQRVATRAVRVNKVIRVPPGLMNPSGRVAVTVKQPDRNAILVASPGQGGADPHGREDIHFVAVGSADLMPRPCSIVGIRAQPTVPLIFPEEVGRRSSSWPPDPASRLELSLAAPRLLPLKKNQAGSSSCAGQDSSTGSYQDSVSETSSEGGTMVLLPWILPKTSPVASHAPRGVSELLQARTSNLPSVGSSGHPDSCRPCTFSHRGRCLAGVWCPKCHGQHRKRNGKLFSVPRQPPLVGDGDGGR